MSITVFLVDDHTVVRDGLRFLLEAQPDIRVVGDAADGRKAVAGIASICPDIVLMDVTMPELNGIEATAYIHQVSPVSQVIILSMHANAQHVSRAIQAGARGYLLKESAGSEVVAAVRIVYRGHRYLSRKLSEAMIEEYLLPANERAEASPLSRLSLREREVMQLTVEGKSNGEIAEILFLSRKTVETYRSRLMRKLEIHEIPSLVKFAILHQLTPVE